ncbi:MAG: hypothetical protein K2X39_02580 [Silvanigrellaceae bacterium]|nr:hypothetical protein [Silvanigrellaceae bacterium]
MAVQKTINYIKNQAKDPDRFAQRLPADNDDVIPNITIYGEDIDVSYSDYVLEKLEATDSAGPILGELTDCCQSIHNPDGHDSAYFGIVDPAAGFYVIRKKNGEPVSQSLAWRLNDGRLVLDSLEREGAFFKKHEQNSLIIACGQMRIL